MDADRFDRLARLLAARLARRAVLALPAALGLFAVGPPGGVGARKKKSPKPGKGRRRCRNGKTACEPGGCGKGTTCITNLRSGPGQPATVCCCPRSVFDPTDKACCPDAYVCRRDPRHPELDECCDPAVYACLPGVGCCRTENVLGGACREDCCNGSCCADNRVCCKGACCGADESCCDAPDGGATCGFCARSIRMRG